MHRSKHIFVLLLAILLCVQSIFGMDFGGFETGTQGSEDLMDFPDFLSEDVLEEAPGEPYAQASSDFSAGDAQTETEPSFSSSNSVSTCQLGSDTDFVTSPASQPRTNSGSSGEENPFQDVYGEESFTEAQELPPEKAYVITIPRIETEGGKRSLKEEVEKLRKSGELKEEIVEASTLSDTVASEGNVFSSIEECGAYAKELMKQRVSSITIQYVTNERFSKDNPYWEDIIDIAQQHTGVGNEGDYLLWGCRSFYGRYSYSSGSGYTLTYEIEYYTTASMEAQIDAKLSEIYGSNSLNLIPAPIFTRYTPYEKIRKIYDYLMDTIEYDYTHLNDSTYTIKHSPYAGLFHGMCVCQGYGVLLYRMLLDNHIDCRCITGENHLWNIVEIYGKYYNVDVTWDDQEVRTYSYFLKCEDAFPDHQREAPYNSAAFYAAYPMSPTNYTGTEKPTSTPIPINTATPTSTPIPINTATPTSTPIPTSTPTPTSTPMPTQREGYRPRIDSEADGYQVIGLEFPIAFPQGYLHTFEVYGASAESRYFGSLIPGDIKWSPYCWGTITGNRFEEPETEEEDQCYTSRTFNISFTYGEYSSATYIIRLYFKAYRWDGNTWQDMGEIQYVTTSFTTEAITPTPAQTATPTPTISTPDRSPYRPSVDSSEDGYLVTGLENPLAFVAGQSHKFTVTGACAEKKYGLDLVKGDGKWVPYGWKLMPDANLYGTPGEEKRKTALTSRTWSMVSAQGIYNDSYEQPLYLTFRLFTWSGSDWVYTETLDTVKTSFGVMHITPTPAPGEEVSLKLNTTELTLYKGASSSYNKAKLSTNQSFYYQEFSSSNKKVAKVSQSGTVTAVGVGEATITVTLPGLEESASCHVRVLLPTLEVEDTLQVKKKKKVTLQVYAYPSGTIKYKSANKSIATVTSKGVVKGKKRGSTYITVTCNKVSRRVRVKVI